MFSLWLTLHSFLLSVSNFVWCQFCPAAMITINFYSSLTTMWRTVCPRPVNVILADRGCVKCCPGAACSHQMAHEWHARDFYFVSFSSLAHMPVNALMSCGVERKKWPWMCFNGYFSETTVVNGSISPIHARSILFFASFRGLGQEVGSSVGRGIVRKDSD